MLQGELVGDEVQDEAGSLDMVLASGPACVFSRGAVSEIFWQGGTYLRARRGVPFGWRTCLPYGGRRPLLTTYLLIKRKAGEIVAEVVRVSGR